MNENEKESEIIVIYLDDKQERERIIVSYQTQFKWISVNIFDDEMCADFFLLTKIIEIDN